MTSQRYPVKPNMGSLVLGALFFGACAVFLFWYAQNTNGLIVNGIELGPETAAIVLVVLSALSLGFVGMALFALLRAREQEVVVGTDAITAPASTWRKLPPRVIRYADISSIREQSISGQDMLTIESYSQKVTLVRSHMPEGAYEEIASALRKRVTK